MLGCSSYKFFSYYTRFLRLYENTSEIFLKTRKYEISVVFIHRTVIFFKKINSNLNAAATQATPNSFCEHSLKMPKPYTKFNVAMQNEFKFLKTVPGSESMVLCTLCDSKFSVADGEITHIKDHTDTKKHIKSLEVVKSNQSINAFLAVDPLKMQIQGEELAFAMNPDAAFDETLLLSQLVFDNV
jgi:hypothetical protein